MHLAMHSTAMDPWSTKDPRTIWRKRLVNLDSSFKRRAGLLLNNTACQRMLFLKAFPWLIRRRQSLINTVQMHSGCPSVRLSDIEACLQFATIWITPSGVKLTSLTQLIEKDNFDHLHLLIFICCFLEASCPRFWGWCELTSTIGHWKATSLAKICIQSCSHWWRVPWPCSHNPVSILGSVFGPRHLFNLRDERSQDWKDSKMLWWRSESKLPSNRGSGRW